MFNIGLLAYAAEMKVLFLLPILACVFTVGQSKVMDRCEVAREFKRMGLDRYHNTKLADWVCIAYHESRYNTAATRHDSDGSTDFGILQINSRYWCKNGREPSSNMCNIQCSALLTDNIAPSVTCAKLVLDKSSNGLGAWTTWKPYCEGRDLSEYVRGCGV